MMFDLKTEAWTVLARLMLDVPEFRIAHVLGPWNATVLDWAWFNGREVRQMETGRMPAAYGDAFKAQVESKVKLLVDRLLAEVRRRKMVIGAASIEVERRASNQDYKLVVIFDGVSPV